jgi:hypothetical protein
MDPGPGGSGEQLACGTGCLVFWVSSRSLVSQLLRGRPRSVTAQASELRECEMGITPFDCPRDSYWSYLNAYQGSEQNWVLLG